MTRVALLCAYASLAATTQGYDSPPPDRYLAVGTSETIGYGVGVNRRYAAIVAHACGWRYSVSAGIDDDHVRLPDADYTGVVSILWSPDYAIFGSAMREARRSVTYLEKNSAKAVFIVFPPQLRRIPALRGVSDEVVRSDERARTTLNGAASARGAVAVNLAVPGSDDLVDGLHPSVNGQRKIAAALIRAARRHSMCELRKM